MATWSPSDRGGLAAGLLFVDGDPTGDITTTGLITGSWRHGTRVDRRGEDHIVDLAESSSPMAILMARWWPATA